MGEPRESAPDDWTLATVPCPVCISDPKTLPNGTTHPKPHVHVFQSQGEWYTEFDRTDSFEFGKESGGWQRKAMPLEIQFLLAARREREKSAASATPLHGESDISGDRAAVAQEKEINERA